MNFKTSDNGMLKVGKRHPMGSGKGAFRLNQKWDQFQCSQWGSVGSGPFKKQPHGANKRGQWDSGKWKMIPKGGEYTYLPEPIECTFI